MIVSRARRSASASLVLTRGARLDCGTHAASFQYPSHSSLRQRLTVVAMAVTLWRFQHIPGPLRRWPSSWQKLSIGPLEIGWP